MDVSIGRLLDALEDLGIENNTLVLFTSDNGPENDAGTAHSCPASEARCRWASVDHTMAEESSTMDYDVKYMGRKRSLMEGGLRVPAIWQWPGKIPAAGTVFVLYSLHQLSALYLAVDSMFWLICVALALYWLY